MYCQKAKGTQEQELCTLIDQQVQCILKVAVIVLKNIFFFYLRIRNINYLSILHYSTYCLTAYIEMGCDLHDSEVPPLQRQPAVPQFTSEGRNHICKLYQGLSGKETITGCIQLIKWPNIFLFIQCFVLSIVNCGLVLQMWVVTLCECVGQGGELPFRK